MKKINKEELMNLYKKNIFKVSSELEILTLGQVVDKLHYGQIAVQYIEDNEQYLNYLNSNERVNVDYLYFDEHDYTLKGCILDDEQGEVICIVKHPSKPKAKFVILNVN